MKTLKILIAVSLFMIASTNLAKADERSSILKRSVELAPSVWESSEIQTPMSLRFIKAKFAFVPVAAFVWGQPSEVPVEITMIPVAPLTFAYHTDEIPTGLEYIKVKNALVPVAPFVLGDAHAEAPELPRK